LDHGAQAELLLISAITAVEVGDDASALAAMEGIEALEESIDDPALESAAQLVRSWVLPIGDDLEAALQAAGTACDGFRRLDDPYEAWAAFTVGLLELNLGRDDAARVHLTEAHELGRRFGNTWLVSSARTQLATLAVGAGRLDEARELVIASVDAGTDTDLSTQTLTFSLVAYARLVLADGDGRRAATALGAADGLRRMVRLQAWPSMRRSEAQLVDRVRRDIDPGIFDAAFFAGSRLDRREAVALVRAENGPDNP
jgi:hypothetical protein